MAAPSDPYGLVQIFFVLIVLIGGFRQFAIQSGRICPNRPHHAPCTLKP